MDTLQHLEIAKQYYADLVTWYFMFSCRNRETNMTLMLEVENGMFSSL